MAKKTSTQVTNITPANLTHKLDSSLKDHVVNVALVGCGGNGSQMLYKLARLDFALRECGHPGGLHVTVFDPDQVSHANIGRQLFSPDDVGLYKCIALVNRINLSYGLSWQARPEIYVEPRSLHRFATAPDLVVTCVDTAAARREIWHAMKKASSRIKPKYWLDLGNSRDSGQVILGQPPLTDEMIATSIPATEFLESGGSWRCPTDALEKAKAELEARRLQTVVEIFPQLLDGRRKEDNTPSCSLAEALDKQSLFVNDQMCAWAAQMLDTLLREGQIDYHGVFINLKNGVARPLPIREREVVVKRSRKPAVKRAATKRTMRAAA